MFCRHCNEVLPEGAAFCESCGAAVPSTQKADPLLGRVLDKKYKIVRKLGEGGFGAVYEAEEPRLGRKAAIKTLHLPLTRNPKVLERFRREGLAASRLAHPLAVKVHDMGETEDGYVWMAMELLEGEPLDSFLYRRGKLPLAEVLELLEPTCEVLDEAHQKGIIHRDVKPQNIFLVKVRDRLVPKLLDFGISKLMEEQDITQSRATMGTPQYMPPEQWDGAKHTTAASDIYSLGVITYQMLSGRLPFAADTPSAWMKQHCLEPPLDLTEAVEGDLLPALSAVVMRSLAKKPQERYATAMEFYQALAECARGADVGVRAEAPALPAPPPALPAPPPASTLQAPSAPSASGAGTGEALSSADSTPSFGELRPHLQEAKPARKAGLPLWLGAGGVTVLLLGVGWFFLFSTPPAAEVAQTPATPTFPDLPQAATIPSDDPHAGFSLAATSPASAPDPAPNEPPKETGTSKAVRGGGTVGGSGQRGGGDEAPKKIEGTVRGGGANIQGALDKAPIQRTIKRAMPGIKLCYEQELKRKPSLAGKVNIFFVIAPNGTVTQSVPKGAGVSPEVDACVAGKIKRLSFPPPDGGGLVEVTFPFIFEPAGAR